MRTLSMKLRKIIPKSRRTRNQEEDNFSSAAEEVDRTKGHGIRPQGIPLCPQGERVNGRKTGSMDM